MVGSPESNVMLVPGLLVVLALVNLALLEAERIGESTMVCRPVREDQEPTGPGPEERSASYLTLPVVLIGLLARGNLIWNQITAAMAICFSACGDRDCQFRNLPQRAGEACAGDRGDHLDGLHEQ